MSPSHLIVAPVVLPLLAGALLLLVERRSTKAAAALGGLATLAGLALAGRLFAQATGDPAQASLIGNWPAPYGIVLVLDRLAALMLLLTALLGAAGWVYASAGDASRGRHFQSLWQFQLMGLNGAFLTGDLFNLFVFFEVLLIASYGLLLHGGSLDRLRAALHYVAFNLAGSALFLVAVALLYGVTGTLNLADLAQRIPSLPADSAPLVRSAASLLIVVFGIKAALLPLYFWLPATYGAASAPVAALFAVMTKVGVYAVLRTSTQLFGADGGALAGAASPWLGILALGTLLLGSVGAVAAHSLRTMAANLVVASAGTLLLAAALARPDAVAAGLVYMVNSTLALAALFLLADRVRASRGAAGDEMVAAPFLRERAALGTAFFVLAVAVAGLPPLAGFLGKTLLLLAAGAGPTGAVVAAVVLGSSLLALIAVARAGSMLFWKPAPEGMSSPAASDPGRGTRARQAASLVALMLLVAGCAVFAGPLSRWSAATAAQLFDPAGYRAAVFGARPAPAAHDVRRELRERQGAGR